MKNVGYATKPLPEVKTRKDTVGYYPSHAEEQGTCKHPTCIGRIYMFCIKCKVHLCCNKIETLFFYSIKTKVIVVI